MTGFIYAIESAGQIKLGYSRFPDKRFAKIATDSPFPCVMLGYWPGTIADELDLHSKFNSDRTHGEWFEASQEILDFVAAWATPPEKPRRRFIVKPDDAPLAVWRKESGVTQGELAELLGVTASAVSQIESGLTSPSLATAVKIMRLADGAVPLESLLNGEAA